LHLLDEGEPFDIDAMPTLDPAELRIGGRGLFLMRTLLDELTCQRREQRGNVLRMVKRRPACRDAG
jgi:anti-sigma regulatory factor (Ser/Thr protein kinase)